MYIFNRVTVIPQLPERIAKLSEIANNLWWSWNTDFLRLFEEIDRDLWEACEKNPVKFLKMISQEKIEEFVNNEELLNKYDSIVKSFDDYMRAENTWYSKNHPENKDELISYFSAEYGLDQTVPIYSGGLGILSGDHLKSASDLGIPFVAIGLLYKNGYFHQRINSKGEQCSEYHDIDLYNLPIQPVKDMIGDDLIIEMPILNRRLYLKIWQINVGRIKLYLLDSDIDKNDMDLREITLKLYGGDREMRIRQEIVLGMAGVKTLKTLGYNPSVYHMNEGHSSFLILELIKDIMNEKNINFDMAKEIATVQTVFTTHTPVPAGNDIFELHLIEKYFHGYWDMLGISKEEFFKMGMPGDQIENGFNMGILALKIAGKKNGVSKLHGEVSRELFSDVWPNIAEDESPITYVTNGIHTCSWLAPNLKDLYNEYLPPYWQDNIQDDNVWEEIEKIPNDRLWAEHVVRKEKLIREIKDNLTSRYLNSGIGFDQVADIVNSLNPKALTIGFARRFATYKRATLIFKDIARLTQILNDEEHPVQLVFAGKAHPNDREGQALIKTIHEISLMPQFKGKIFVLENYNIGLSRYLISGVDVWLNNPRRPMEASGTSGEKASVNGVINFSVLDGWWCEGYNGENGWTIGTNAQYDSYEEQDKADSNSLYHTLETKIIPAYCNQNENGVSDDWMRYMKNSIKSTGGKYSTSRMVIDYVDELYLPLCNLRKSYFNDVEKVKSFSEWKKIVKRNWDKITINQDRNIDNARLAAGSQITVTCEVELPEIDEASADIQVYFGQFLENGTVKNVYTETMNKIGYDEANKKYIYEAVLDLKSGGNYGYTFRAMPKHEMLVDQEDMNLIKWITK